MTVAATYHPPQADPVLPNVVISQAAFDRTFPRPQDAQAFLNVNGGPSAAMTAELKRALAAYPDAKIQTRAAWVTTQAKSVDQVLDLFYVLLALSVIISVFGMINTLVLAVFERTRELGMLRAIGMSRRQMRRMIRHESVVTALIGAALGLPLGVLLAALTTRALGSLGIGFHLPGSSWPRSSCSRWWPASEPPSSPPAERRASTYSRHSSTSDHAPDGSRPAPPPAGNRVFSTSAPAGPQIATWPFSTLWDDDWSCIGGSEALIADLLQDRVLGRQARRASLGEDATPPGHAAE